jgi:catechol 2,3-dioxygenase-like lactoylglutathione lyase family enzyme
MEPYLEHINITSTDVDATVRFLQTAMPELKIRGGGEGEICLHWVHLGTGTTYIAIEDRGVTEKGPHIAYEHSGVNHVGFVVGDGEALFSRMREAGYREGPHNFEHPARNRYYFYDQDDNEYEFIEYSSTSASERNDYAG